MVKPLLGTSMALGRRGKRSSQAFWILGIEAFHSEEKALRDISHCEALWSGTERVMSFSSTWVPSPNTLMMRTKRRLLTLKILDIVSIIIESTRGEPAWSRWLMSDLSSSLEDFQPQSRKRKPEGSPAKTARKKQKTGYSPCVIHLICQMPPTRSHCSSLERHLRRERKKVKK